MKVRTLNCTRAEGEEEGQDVQSWM